MVFAFGTRGGEISSISLDEAVSADHIPPFAASTVDFDSSEALLATERTGFVPCEPISDAFRVVGVAAEQLCSAVFIETDAASSLLSQNLICFGLWRPLDSLYHAADFLLLDPIDLSDLFWCSELVVGNFG